MIQLTNITLKLSVGKQRKLILDDLTVSLPTDRRFILLGHHSSGKTSIIRLLAGLLLPTDGSIERFAHVSFPVGLARGFLPHLSVQRNLIHAAELYDVDPDDTVNFVKELTGDVAVLDELWQALPTPSRSILAYALSYAIPFDTYLIDNFIGVGDAVLRQKFTALLERRLETAGMIMATRDVRMAKRYGEAAGIIRQGKIDLYDNVDAAIKEFGRMHDAPTSIPSTESSAYLDADE